MRIHSRGEHKMECSVSKLTAMITSRRRLMLNDAMAAGGAPSSQLSARALNGWGPPDASFVRVRANPKI